MRESILKRLKGIFDEMDFLGNECAIDSLIRIDENIYNCHNCTVTDTINTVRIMCPLIMKRETKILK